MDTAPRDNTRTNITSEEQWLELRRRNIGASEAGALRGEHEHTTAYSLSALKLGLIKPQADNEAMERGRELQPVALRKLQKMHPDWEVWDPMAYFCDKRARLGCTPDAMIQIKGGPAGVAQIKSVEPGAFRRKWLDSAGSIVVPKWIRTQVMLEMHLTGLELGFVAALVIGHGIELHVVEVPFDHDVIDDLYAKANEFWERVDAGMLVDPDFGRDGATIGEVYAQDDASEIDLSHDNELPALVSELERCREIAAEASLAADTAKARVLDRIGRAALIKYAGGYITAKTVTIKEHVRQASQVRRLSVRKAKEGSDE